MVRHRRQSTGSTLPPAGAVRIALFGLDCAFTNAFTETLLESGVAISAIILPGPPSSPTPIRATLPRRSIALNAPDGQREGILGIADAHQIPVWRVGNLHVPRSTDLIASIQAELLVCACFNRKIPAALYERFSLGGLNGHPSLLPDKRGPDPQFWVLKEGTESTGVTIHRLSQRFDAGPILAQVAVSYPDGTSEIDLDSLTGASGARLLAELLPDLRAGTATETEQDHARATYAAFPTASDFLLDLNRPARAAYNFARGIAGRGVPILVDWDGQTHRVVDALDYADEPHPQAATNTSTRWVPCTPGWVLLRFAPSEN